MPLVALDTPTDLRLDATAIGDEEWAELHRKRTGERLRCRECGHGLHAKLMPGGRRYFAHNAGASDCPSNGESESHLRLKTKFAEGFRSVGWDGVLEYAEADWRADVLGVSSDGRRVAIEVQVSPIHAELVEERSAKHAAAGVETLWVVPVKRPVWATGRPVPVVSAEDKIIDSVIVGDGDQHRHHPVSAGPVSISRFVERLAQGRLTPIVDRPAGYRAWDPTVLLQLDGCLDAYRRAEQLRAEQKRQAERERLERDQREAREKWERERPAREAAEREKAARKLEKWRRKQAAKQRRDSRIAERDARVAEIAAQVAAEARHPRLVGWWAPGTDELRVPAIDSSKLVFADALLHEGRLTETPDRFTSFVRLRSGRRAGYYWQLDGCVDEFLARVVAEHP